ncbi:DUF4376 domain-containing protein [Methyloversatilis sp.]|uniref:DUF4376 domain-containing protein n=1 Tax=Methyloversatilis sp. TaxID=2569862 RepID=UPI0027324A67|nr:DUF4376 domain-containing protein [Methyloversatilis sp.]MDP3579135.1 DUF4376 domain-containing protein [Methyloversatilis sp.]
MLYSAQTGGFYSRAIHGANVPSDVVEITPQQHTSLLQAQAQGQRIVPGVGGFPSAQAQHVTMTELRESKIREIDAARDAAARGGFLYAGVRYDSDTQSIQRINGAVTLSLLDPTFETPWITEDNSVVTLDAEALRGLGQAAGEHEAQQIFKARALKDAVLAATTEAQIAAIEW